MYKYFLPQNYYYYFQQKIYNMCYGEAKKQKILNELKKYESIGIDIDRSIEKLNIFFKEKYNREFSFENDSIHWFLATGISLRGDGVRKILEFGTYDGEFTSLLAYLFPDTQIVTIDLPESDPILRSSYNREDEKVYKDFNSKLKKNIDHKNIISLKCNSFFLLESVKDRDYDLIWVDGGHNYPEISIDISNAYYLCRESGIIMCDDVLLEVKSYRDDYISTHSREVLEYLKIRKNSIFIYFLKRRRVLSNFGFIKDYVAYIEK